MNAGTKMLLICAAITAGSLTGLFFSKKLKTRADYYRALCDLFERFLSEVKFRKTPVKTVFAEFAGIQETPLSKNLTEYISASDPTLVQLSRGCLNKDEAAVIQKFLSELGGLDSATQIGELEAFLERMRSKETACKEMREKYGSVYIKLGFLAGLALGVLLL